MSFAHDGCTTDDVHLCHVRSLVLLRIRGSGGTEERDVQYVADAREPTLRLGQDQPMAVLATLGVLVPRTLCQYGMSQCRISTLTFKL